MWFRRVGRRFTASVAIWFRTLSGFSKIAVCVALAHLFILCALWIQHLASSFQTPKRPLTVRIHQPKCTPPSQSTARTTPKPVKPKKPAAKKPPANSNSLRQIEQSLDTRITPRPMRKSTPEIKLPSKLEETPITVLEESPHKAHSYGITLIDSLQQQLQLPETGEVKARIAIESPGRIAFVEILDARSAKNAEWLKIQLPLATLPCFNDFNISDANLEFTVTFRNVEEH